MEMFTKILIAFLLAFLILRQAVAQQDDRYLFQYPQDFFDTGAEEIEFNPTNHNKIGGSYG